VFRLLRASNRFIPIIVTKRQITISVSKILEGRNEPTRTAIDISARFGHAWRMACVGHLQPGLLGSVRHRLCNLGLGMADREGLGGSQTVVEGAIGERLDRWTDVVWLPDVSEV